MRSLVRRPSLSSCCPRGRGDRAVSSRRHCGSRRPPRGVGLVRSITSGAKPAAPCARQSAQRVDLHRPLKGLVDWTMSGGRRQVTDPLRFGRLLRLGDERRGEETAGLGAEEHRAAHPWSDPMSSVYPPIPDRRRGAATGSTAALVPGRPSRPALRESCRSLLASFDLSTRAIPPGGVHALHHVRVL